MMTAEFVLLKRPVLRFTAALFFLLKLLSSHIYCIRNKAVSTFEGHQHSDTHRLIECKINYVDSLKTFKTGSRAKKNSVGGLGSEVPQKLTRSLRFN